MAKRATDPMADWQRRLRPGDLIGIAQNNAGIFPTVIFGIFDWTSHRNNYVAPPPHANAWSDVHWDPKDTGVGDGHWICSIRHIPLYTPFKWDYGRKDMTIAAPMAFGDHVSRRIIPYSEDLLTEFETERLHKIRKRLF